MRNKTPQTLRDVVGQLIKAYRLDGKLRAVDLRTAWPEIVGKFVNGYTRDLALKDGILTIWFKPETPPALRQELSYAQTDVLEQVNVYLSKKGETIRVNTIKIY